MRALRMPNHGYEKAKTPSRPEGVLGCDCVSGGALTSGSTASLNSSSFLLRSTNANPVISHIDQAHRQKGFPHVDFMRGSYPYLVTMNWLSLPCATCAAPGSIPRLVQSQDIADKIVTCQPAINHNSDLVDVTFGDSVNYRDAWSDMTASNYRTLNVLCLVDSTRSPCKEHRHRIHRHTAPLLLH
jgi:hypothetical protein